MVSEMRIPRKNSVWAFRNGPRHDIIEKIFFINKGKKKIFMVEWNSGFRSTLVRELFKYFEYKGFFTQINS